jgi:8-oxo-dGTP diphosphatase
MVWTVNREAIRYCPLCGESIGSRERDYGTYPYCADCDLTVYRTPEPMGRATVVDGDSLLLVQHGEGPNAGTWALAGGRPEYGEPARVGAARELEEETGLRVDPADLELIGDGYVDLEGSMLVSFNYAAPASAAEGTVEAADDAADARFWSREEIVEDPPLARASGTEQLLDAIDRFGDAD